MINDINPTLLNVTYIRAAPATNTKEHFEVVYRGDDGNIHLIEEPPLCTIYFTKEEYRDHNYNKPHERIEKLYPVVVPYSKIRNTIEKEMGAEAKEFTRQCIQNRDFKALDKLYLWPYSYRADFIPEFYYLSEYIKRYPLPSTIKLTRSFIDIEVDQIDGQADLDDIPNNADYPINCVTLVFEENLQCHTFILRPFEPLRMKRTDEEFQKRMSYYKTQLREHEQLMADPNRFIKSLNDEFEAIYGRLDYYLHEFDSEINLISQVFNTINHFRPNFCEAWNMRFDIQYIIYRIKTLGYNPAEIICHQDFNSKECFFRVDNSTYQQEKQYDYFYCRSYTQYICQMRLYAAIRKSQHQLKSVSLNYIANRELRDSKVEYQNEGSITDLCYLNWIKYIRYNIKDTLLQLGIERKTNDVMTYYLRMVKNVTPYSKIFRETHLIRYVREIYFNSAGWVQGNNINLLKLRYSRSRDTFSDIEESEIVNDDQDDESTFKGGINAEPSMNSFNGMEVNESPTNIIYENCIDYDMSKFYPSVKIATNLDPITLLWKAILKDPSGAMNDEFITGKMINNSLNQVYTETDKDGNLRKLDHTGECVNMFVTKNILSFGYSWLNLPSITSLYKIVKEKIK